MTLQKLILNVNLYCVVLKVTRNNVALECLVTSCVLIICITVCQPVNVALKVV